jgi:hypothetical protein
MHMNPNAASPPNLDAELSRAQRRTIQYWFDDGLVEVVVGSGFLLMGLCFVLLGTVPLPGYVNLIPIALMFGTILAGPRLIRKAKERLVYRRTGYVSFTRPSPRRRWLTPLVGFVIASLLGVLVAKAPSLEVWVPAGLGLLMAAFFLRMNRSAQLSRISVLAGVSALTGLLVSLHGDTGNMAGGIYFTVVGAVMAAGGALALRSYLRHAPPPEVA